MRHQSLPAMQRHCWQDSLAKHLAQLVRQMSLCQLAFLCLQLMSLGMRLCQGLSQAGAQKGLGDERSSLVKEIFKTFDRMPRGPAPQKDFDAFDVGVIWKRKFCQS